MNRIDIAVNRALLLIVAVASGVAAVFFAYYTLRLMYINVAGLVQATRRQSGMHIGFVSFPSATIAFGWMSRRCARAAAR